MLSENQRALLADLVSHILAELELRDFMHQSGGSGLIFYHGGHPSFEAACAVLQHRNLAHPVDGKTGEPCADRGEWSMNFRLAERGFIADILPDQHAVDLTVIDEALSVFLDLKITYGAAPALTATRASFEIPAGLERTIALLGACGYVEGDAHYVRWTKKCSWAMRKAFLWKSDDISVEDDDKAACDAEARRILASMPDDVRQLSFGRGPNPLGLALEIARRWRDERWQRPITGQVSISGQIALARRVIELGST